MTDTKPSKYSPNDFELRDAKETDITSITAIYAHHVEHGLASFEEIPPNANEMLRRFQLTIGKNQPYYVVEHVESSEIVGYCYAGSFRDRNAYRFTLESTLYLKPGFEGCGLGGRMLDKLVDEGQKRGFRQIIGVIGDSENAGSIGVHKSRGFTMIGTLEGTGFKHGRWVDTVLMQRSLGDGNSTVP